MRSAMQATPELSFVSQRGVDAGRLEPLAASPEAVARFEQAMSAPQMASAAQKVLPPDVATMEIGVAQSAHSGVIDSARQYAESLSDRWASTHEMIQQAVRKESFSPKDMLVIQWEVIKVGLNLEITSK